MSNKTPALLVLNRHDRYAFLRQLIEFRDAKHKDIRIIVTHESESSAVATLSAKERVSFRVVPGVIMNEFPSWLIKLCEDEGISMILPTGDVEMIHLSGQKDFFLQRGVRMAIPEQKLAVSILDKAAYGDAFADKRWRIPHTVVVGGQSVEDIVSRLGDYPLFVKPRIGSSSTSTKLIRSRRHLADALTGTSDWIIQEYISGQAYTVDVLADSNGTNSIVAVRQRLLVSGPHAVAIESVCDDYLVQFATHFAARAGIPGLWNFQFILCEKTGVPVVHDINPRIANGVLHSIARGLPVFDWVLRSCSGENVVVLSCPLKHPVVMMLHQTGFVVDPCNLPP